MDEHTLERAFGTPFVDRNDNYKGLCPFHDERTPSFYVHKYNFIGHCFGCGVSGYIDQLASNLLHVSIGEARDQLEVSVSEKHTARSKRHLFRRAPVTIYPESWLAPWKKEIHAYITSRQFNIEVLKRSETLFDSSTCRQVFPHRRREDGKLIGAIGRSCRGEDPKWYFYWDYEKGRHLYRPFERETTHTALRSVLVVEGVFDLLWLKQLNYSDYLDYIDVDLAATLGTKVTLDQVRELREYDEVILMMDNDVAGREATERLYKSLRKSCRVYFYDWHADEKDAMDIESLRQPLTRIEYVKNKTGSVK